MKPEFRKKLFDYFKDAYLFQLDQREKISNRNAIVFAVLTVAANMALAYIQDLPKYDSSPWTLGFYFLLVVAFLGGGATLFYLLKAVAQGRKWAYPPTPVKILAAVNDMEERSATGTRGTPLDVEDKFETNLIRQFAEVASHNEGNNSAKNLFVLRATQLASATVVTLIACAPFHYYLKSKAEKPVQRVELVRPTQIKR